MPRSIEAAIDAGIKWLVSKQNLSANGSWGTDPYGDKTFNVSTTGLVLLKLEDRALDLGYNSALDTDYEYHYNVEKGLEYLFSQVQLDIPGQIYFYDLEGGWRKDMTYATSIAMCAICASARPSEIVKNGPLIGMTYKAVVEKLIQFLKATQRSNGGWNYYYTDGTPPDNSNTGYASLALAFAMNYNKYKFNCTIDPAIINGLNNWVNVIQFLNPSYPQYTGGSAYRSTITEPLPPPSTKSEFVNCLRTGNLLQQMNFCQRDENTSNVQAALKFMANNWYNTSGSGDDKCPFNCWINTGWRIRPQADQCLAKGADYQATFATAKGLHAYNVKYIKGSSLTEIDWFEDMSKAILNEQNADGSWPKCQWDANLHGSGLPLMSTAWALLSLEPFVNNNAVINYENSVTYDKTPNNCISDLIKKLEIENEVKVFSYKFMNTEGSCSNPPRKATHGDSVVFTLVFGNYGEADYIPNNNTPTVEDILFIESPIVLTLKSICVGNGIGGFGELPSTYRLYNLTDNKVVTQCDKFYGNKTYNLQVQRLSTYAIPPNPPGWYNNFALRCHSINCITMLFEIQYTGCVRCMEFTTIPGQIIS